MASLVSHWQSPPALKPLQTPIKRYLAGVLRRLGRADRVELEIIITSDKEIKALKKRYFDIDEPTDVLSFAYDNQIEKLTGSIVISAETAARQALTAGIKLEDEIKTLASHGLLHLLGYQHT